MTGRRRLGLVAGRRATLLAAAPLSAIFESWTWLLQCILAVGLIAGAATLARTLRVPLWAQRSAWSCALLLALTWMFPSGDELAGADPDAGHVRPLRRRCSATPATDTRAYGVPGARTATACCSSPSLGIGAVAIVVDLLAVGLRRPALAGLPMLAIYSVPVAVYVDSVPVLPFVVGADRLPLAAGRRQRRPGTPVRPPVHRRRPRRRRLGAVAAGRGRAPARPWSAWSRPCCCRWPCPA